MNQEDPFKICLLNCSPRKNGRTIRLAQEFIEGLKEIQAIETSIHHLADLEIQPCLGCSHCWFSEPGICIQDDDFHSIIDSILDNDLIIFCSPIWCGSGTHYFRNLTERFFSIVSPYFTKKTNHFGHHRRSGRSAIRTFLVSSCALPGTHNFKPLIEHCRALDYLCEFQYSGHLLKDQSLEMDFEGLNSDNQLAKFCNDKGKKYHLGQTKKSGFMEFLVPSILAPDSYISHCDELFNLRFQDRQSQK